MDDKTYISYGETEQVINEIADCRNKMSAIFDDFKADMANIESPDTLVGAAGETISAKFGRLSTRFEEYLELVKEFEEDIRTASQMTDATDHDIANDGEDLVG